MDRKERKVLYELLGEPIPLSEREEEELRDLRVLVQELQQGRDKLCDRILKLEDSSRNREAYLQMVLSSTEERIKEAEERSDGRNAKRIHILEEKNKNQSEYMLHLLATMDADTKKLAEFEQKVAEVEKLQKKIVEDSESYASLARIREHYTFQDRELRKRIKELEGLADYQLKRMAEKDAEIDALRIELTEKKNYAENLELGHEEDLRKLKEQMRDFMIREMDKLVKSLE